MPLNDFDYDELTKTLTDNFNILADEVQLLSDRKTILEHKLRFAHEQVRTYACIFPLQMDGASLYDDILALDLELLQAVATTDKHHVS